MRVGLTIVMLWIASALQQGVAPSVAIFGCAPDFMIVVLAPLSMAYGRSGGALVGFFAGVLHGGLAGANLAQYAASRAIAGFTGAWTGSTIENVHAFAAFFHAAGLSLFTQVVFMFMAPPSQIGPYLLATIGTAVYNGVIALPVYALLRKTIRKDPI